MTDAAPPTTQDLANSQYRIRDLLSITLGLSLLLGAGRAIGGKIEQEEALLALLGSASIGVAAFFLRRRWVWGICLAATFVLTVIFGTHSVFLRFSMGSVLAAHFLFAAMPVLALDVRQRRWPWAALAAGCQIAAALYGWDALRTIAFAALSSWLLAITALAWRYRQLARHRAPLRLPVEKAS